MWYIHHSSLEMKQKIAKEFGVVSCLGNLSIQLRTCIAFMPHHKAGFDGLTFIRLTREMH